MEEEHCCCESSIEELAADILIARISVPGLGIHPSIEKVCEEYEAIYRTIYRLVHEQEAESSGGKKHAS
ncbi:MAG: hypothetical protein FJY66_04000 [Calditrichaeota bacterium]|nr:hypothetical protein [Calditrichota bacterium]